MKKQERNAAIELLRMLAMLGVVVLHYNNKNAGGGLRYATGANYAALAVLECVFICAVNLYVLISGYFLSGTQKRSLSKPFALLVQVCAFGAGKYLLRCLLYGGWSVKTLVISMIPNNYFVMLYIALYLVSPYVNLMLQRLSAKGFRQLVILLLCLFSVWPTLVDVFIEATGKAFTGLSTVNAFASQRGYTIVQFVLMYILGAYIRREQETLCKVPAIPVFAGCVALLWGWSAVSATNAWAYHNPLVILSACAAMLIALRRQFQSKWVNRLAQGAFTCYLLHDFFLKYLGIPQAAASSLPLMLLHVLLSAVGIYLICFAAYLLWDLVTKPVFQRLAKRLSGPDRFVAPQEQEVGKEEVTK